MVFDSQVIRHPEMAVTSNKRLQLTSTRRAVLGAVLIAWVSALFQPCLMAMEMSPEPAAHSAVSAGHASHGGHGNHSSDGNAEPIHNCAHCPPSADVRNQADCDSPSAAKHDSRYPKLDTRDVDHSPDWLPPSVVQALDLKYRKFLTLPQDKSIGPIGPALSILFCRYLK